MQIKPFDWPADIEFIRRQETKYIIIHHSKSGDVSAGKIHGWHLDRDWLGIGYNYVIRADGNIEQGRPHWAQGAHCKGENDVSVGICLTGNFNEDEPSQEQLNSTVQLIKWLQGEHYPNANPAKHEDFVVTDCPGDKFPWAKFINMLEDDNVSVFKDVSKEAWYYGPILKASELGIMDGYPDGLFRPDEHIKRGEMASVAVRLYHLTSEETRAQKVWDDWSESVVVIKAEKSGGSGFFIDDKTIVTNAHVVNGVNEVSVKTKNQGIFVGEVKRRGATWPEGQDYPEAVEGSKVIDLATIELTKKADSNAVWGDGFKPVEFAKEMPPEEMSFVVIIGNPLLIEFWGSYGVVSRSTNFFINTDAAINPGNSGGAAFNLDGEFIGVPTRKYTGNKVDNMGSMIRADAVKLWLEGRVDEIKF